MQRLSSRSTFFTKRFFPIMWFGVLGCILVAAFGFSIPRGRAHLEFLALLLTVGVGGLVLMRRLLFDLVDEVWDDGDALIVKSGRFEDRIALSNIECLNINSMSHPPRVMLQLRTPCLLGASITFTPLEEYFPFATHPVATGLISRIEQSRGMGKREALHDVVHEMQVGAGNFT